MEFKKLALALAVLTLVGCNQSAQTNAAEQSSEIAPVTGETIKNDTSKLADNVATYTKESASDLADKAQDQGDKAWDATKETTSDLADKAEEKGAEAWDSTKETVSDLADKAKESIN